VCLGLTFMLVPPTPASRNQAMDIERSNELQALDLLFDMN
jgi:hypothetical protein